MRRSRAETQEALAGVVLAIIGVLVVSALPPDLRTVGIVLLIAVYFIAFLLRAYLRSRRSGDGSSDEEP